MLRHFFPPLFALLVVCAFTSRAQTGGSFDLSHNVIAGGGESRSSGGAFIIDGTAGQPQAGTVSSGANFDLRGGFWVGLTPVPTAARVSIMGRVVRNGNIPSGRIRILLIQLRSGAVLEVRPNQFGYYRFDDLEIGSYILSAESANCRFQPGEMFINLFDNLTQADFSEISP